MNHTAAIVRDKDGVIHVRFSNDRPRVHDDDVVIEIIEDADFRSLMSRVNRRLDEIRKSQPN